MAEGSKYGTLKISVIICTYNREKYLDKAIDSLLDQSLSLSEYEIIVVDNASTDNTANLVKGYGNKVKYIYEPNQGLSYARNTGFKNSAADIVAYLDDDAIACKDWLSNILKAFEIDSAIAAVGGIIEPIWEAKKPRWVIKELYPHFSCQDKGPNPFFLKGYDYFYGGNAIYKKEVLYKSGGFPVKLGRIGKIQLVHEEWPIFNYINQNGLKKYYMPGILIRHHVMKHRLNIRWMINRFFWLGASAVYHDIWYGHLSIRKVFIKHLKAMLHYYSGFVNTKPILLMLNLARYVGVSYALVTYRSNL